MKATEFCYWLQGYFELMNEAHVGNRNNTLSPDQVASIQRHLALVFKHEIDPSYPEAQQQKLNEIHQHPWPDLNQSATIPANPNALIRC